MTAPFEDTEAAKMWDSYFAEFDHLSAPLADEGRELRTELERHVLDSMAAPTNDDATGSTGLRLEEAFKRLGDPIEYLRPLLTDQYISDATHSYNPVVIGKGLFHSILEGGSQFIKASLFAVAYLFIAVFVVIALSKPFWPDQVGLFRDPDGIISVGILADTAGTQELLGWWAIPAALLLAGLIYYLLTRALKSLARRQ